MFHILMSLLMINRMFGFLSCAWAVVTMNATHKTTTHYFSIFSFGFIISCFVSPNVQSTTLDPATETFGKIRLSLIARNRTDETLVLQLSALRKSTMTG